jgi:protease PrsW
MTLMPSTTRPWRRYAWLGTLIVLGGLYALVLITLVRTENPNLVPSVILLGATVVPVSFLVFAEGRTGHWQVSPAVLICTAFFGGVIGVVVAGWLEFDALRGLGALPMLFVAIIEETAKLVVPVVILVLTLRAGRREPADGLVIGVASGVGFAALETMGYAFTALLSSKGSIGAVEQTLLIRGVMAPAGHIAWTGLTTGALWALAARPGGRRLGTFLGVFAFAIALHTLWDSIGSSLAYLVLSVVSVGSLLYAMRRYRALSR